MSGGGKQMGHSVNVTVQEMIAEEWDGVRSILLEGIASGDATFDTTVPTWEAWDASHLARPRLIACTGRQILGWAALSPVSTRSAYSGVAWASVYVTSRARRQGVGQALLHALVERSEEEGYWTLQAGIFPENVASLALHRSCGFRLVGRRERLGRLNGVWRDVILMERRSPTVGQP